MRQNIHSGNLLFGGKKNGQESDFFFDKSVCTCLTEKVSYGLKWILNIFKSYSEYPTELGCSDFTGFNEDGVSVEENVFPYAVCLKPRLKVDDFLRGETFVDDLCKIPFGTIIYDIYCIRDPSRAQEISKIGEIKTESEVVVSGGDSGIFFKHQKREEDFEIEHEWKVWREKRRGEIGSSWFDRIIDDE